MKKIYMILAAMTLLTLSLNAQNSTKDHLVKKTSTTEKQVDMPQLGFKKALNLGVKHAPNHAPQRANRGTMTWSWVGANNGTTLPTGWTMTDPDHSALNDNGDGTWYIGVSNDGSATAQSITIPASVFSGCDNVTVVIRAKIDTGYSGKSISVNGSSKTLSNTLTDYTWENVSTTNGILIEPTDGYVGFASIIITGEIDSNDETICEGSETNEYLPIYGYWYDSKQINQMIYPSSMLTNLNGKKITSMTFYSPHIYFSGGAFNVKVGETSQESFSSTTRNTTDLSATVVSGMAAPTAGGTELTIIFSEPFEYNGGNLLVDFEVTTTGSYGSNHTYFYGVNHTGGGFYSRGSSIDNATGVYTSSKEVLDFLPKVTFAFEGEEEQPTYSSDGIIRMGNLIIVDQFWASTAENTHPEQYSYILRYTPAQGNPKESSPKTVDVEHVKSVVNGYYTEEDVKNDSITYNTVIVNKMTADVEMTLPNNDNKIYYVRLQGKDNDVPSEADKVNDNSDMIVKLQMTSGDGGFYYIDQIPTSHPQYTPGQVNHFMDPAEPGTGSSYGDFKTYVPSVMTYGQSRRYFANDTLHNTYGAPVWRTGIGDVTIQNGMKVERQSNQWGSTQWEANGQACSLYILDNILAYGKLPNKQNSNVDYEPYMFRVYVESPSGKLRGYTPQNVYSPEKPDSIIGTELVADNSFTNFTGPICIYSEYFDGASHIDTVADATNGDYFKFTLNKNSDNWVDNAMFGGLDDIIQGEGDDLSLSDQDLKVYVRFYYRSKGSMNPSHVIRGRDGSLPHMYYGAEAESPTPDPWTSVTEVRSHGEIIGVTYVNAQGMTSNKPFDGLNIVVTRYSDGSTTTTKVVR